MFGKFSDGFFQALETLGGGRKIAKLVAVHAENFFRGAEVGLAGF
jgi:hypothetical protein